jgi:hypothetical protein
MFQLWICTHWGTWQQSDSFDSLAALEGVWAGLREIHNLTDYMVIPL